MVQSPGKIYLADQRGILETSAFKQQSTFNFQEYYNEHKQPFGNLFICNDVYVRSGEQLNLVSEENAIHIFLPITGGVDIVYRNELINADAGGLKVLCLNKKEEVLISNPYDDGLINYLHLALKTEIKTNVASIGFDLSSNYNVILPLVSVKGNNLPFNLSIGIFGGRQEAVYVTENNENGVYFFIIDGAFEIEGRLMHSRDGLALWDIKSAEFEALSNNAIVVVFETER